MKKFVLAAAASAAALVSFAGAADAAQFQSINQRQAQLNQRIQQGVRSGALSRQETVQLRNRFAQLQRLEQQYRRGGLTLAERRDLDRRFNALAASIRIQKNDRNFRR
jgi:Ni/Co efflux regulator RcnB